MTTSRFTIAGFGIAGLGLALSLLAMVSMASQGRNASRLVPALITGLAITATASIPLGIGHERQRF